MDYRRSAGWRLARLAAAIATLSLLFPSATLAKTPRAAIEPGVGSFTVADNQRDGPARRAQFARANYVWTYGTGPYYGDVDLDSRRSAGVVHTTVGSFDLARGSLNIPAELKSPNRLADLGAQYFILALDPNAGELSTELMNAIQGRGGAVVHMMPVASWIARLTPEALAAAQSSSAVLSVEPYHAAFKLEPSIGRTPLHSPMKALSEVYDLDVRLFKGETAEAVAAELARLGGNVISVFPDTVRVEIHRSMLPAIASLEPVQMVHEHLPLYPMSEETTTTMQTGRWNQGAIPYHDAGIDGSGGGLASEQVIMVLDTGIQVDSGDLSDTRTSAGTVGITHRKVRRYESTAAWGGTGDLLGCDANINGGFTHGQFVAATALGNATEVPLAYGEGWIGTDQNDNDWKLDGVAPGALLVAFDGQTTPVAVSCSDPEQDTVSPGDLYSGGSTGSLGSSYTTNGARVFNFSWGGLNNTYTPNAQDIDTFINDKKDAMVFVSAGNAALDEDPRDGVPDPGSIGAPATTKNGLSIGASRNADDTGNDTGPNSRASFSSVGPAVGGRIAPVLMAPGDEFGGGTMGFSSEFGCRTSENEHSGVECDVISGIEGTSFASPAAAGAGALVRDYFEQGFYPDGRSDNPGNAADQVSISGAMLKAVLVASADYMTGANLTRPWRFSREQGYGRIQLDNALPLESWAPSPPGLIVCDGDGTACNLSGMGAITAMNVAETDTATFEVCDPTEELRIALAWVEASGENLINDLELTVTSPDPDGGGPLQPVIYRGNYFTDDNDRDLVLDQVANGDPADEDCPHPDGTAGELATFAEAAWSLPICGNTPGSIDADNPTEAVMLSPDYDGDGENDLDPDDDDQIIPGTWTVEVNNVPNSNPGTQTYSLVIAGGVCLGSSVRFDRYTYPCNGLAAITVNEADEATDPAAGLTVTEVGGRVTVEVVAHDVCDDGVTSCTGVADCVPAGGGPCNASLIVDTETGADLGFSRPDPVALQYVAENVILTDGTAFDPGNGALDIRNGHELRVIYADETSGAPDADKARTSTAEVDCEPAVSFGDVVFPQLGQDTGYLVSGGCERNARSQFEFGFPDRYMDAEELISYNFAFASSESEDLDLVEVNLRCVIADGDSPEECKPNSLSCADPNRLNNPSCDGTGMGGTQYMTILDTPKTIDLVPAGSALSANFSIRMEPAVSGTPEVEMILEISSRTSGKPAAGIAINRHTLNVDEESVFYSTDFPTGGTEVYDRNNNEVEENPTTNIGNFLEDYRFETIQWSDLTAGGTKNMSLQSPWSFDLNNGGFISGLGATTDEGTITDIIAQWGEDKNFNGLLDGYCDTDPSVVCQTKIECINAGLPSTSTCISIEDRDPVNLTLDANWGTTGGCGWQTRDDAATTGGIWHTGRIGNTTAAACLVDGNNPGQCQGYEVVSGDTGQRLWHELLLTPEIHKVGGAESSVQITNWAWNQAIDLADTNAFWTWELDTDTAAIEPTDLIADLSVLNFGNGAYGAVVNQNNPELTNGFSVFAPVQGNCQLSTGTDCFVNEDCPLFCEPPNETAVCATDHDCGGACMVCTGDGVTTCTYDSDCDPPLGPGGTCTAVGTTLCSEPGDLYSLQCQGGFCSPLRCDSCVNAQDFNGTAGNNRRGQNSCFFRGPTGGIAPTALNDLGLPAPPDDDIDNDSDLATDEYVRLNGPIRNMDLFAFNGPDMRFQTLEDIYGETGETFQAALGMLNFEKGGNTDPDPASSYGIGVDDMVIDWREFELVEDTTTCDPASRVCTGDGATPCTSDADCTVAGGICSGGACAVINLQTTNFFESNALLEITVLEKSPPAVNDCNYDGDTDDVGDDTDCDDDLTADLVVKATSEAEVSGEIVYANATGAPDEYKAFLPVSALYDVDGVLFVHPSGTEDPTVTVLYLDEDDGTGQICRNDVDPAAQGRVEASTTLFFTLGSITVLNAVIQDNGDGDSWADTNETVEMRIEVSNTSGVDLTGVVARLSTNDPKIDCVLDSAIDFGDLADGEVATSTDFFSFRVGDVQRTGTCTVGGNTCTTDADCTAGGGDSCNAGWIDFTAEFTVLVSSREFDSTLVPQTVTLDLDLDAIGGSGPTQFVESFEGGTFGTFTTMNLDAGRNSEEASEGWRCQYSDPDWHNSNPYGEVDDCWLGASAAQADRYHWQVDGPSNPVDGGRAYHGTHSIYMGVVGPDYYTTPMALVEAIRTTDPINIGHFDVCETTRTIPCSDDTDCPGGESCVGVTPELSFKHQISLVDSRVVSAPPYESADGAAVGVQLAAPDAGGTPVGDWIKIEPYYNVYDSQRSDNYTECFFDPTDDGTTEDDFFDPTDPDRRLGPSTLCYPEFVFVHQGDTDAPWCPDGYICLGHASDGPGLPGDTGTGTWVESKFNLQRFLGRRLRVRLINGAIKATNFETMEDIFEWNPEPADDGWWVDDIRVTDTLINYVHIVADTKDNSALPVCGTACSTVTAALAADPPALPAPGQAVELSAAASTADRCVDGTLQYRFWIDANGDGAGGDSTDTLLRGWTDNPALIQAPLGNTSYAVDVRCSSLPGTCVGTAALAVPVSCPDSSPAARELGPFPKELLAYPGYCSGESTEFCTDSGYCAAEGLGSCVIPSDGTLFLSWEPDKGRRIRLTELSSGEEEKEGEKLLQGGFFDTLDVHLERLPTRGFRDERLPSNPGAFLWYLMTEDNEGCNLKGSWQTAAGAEPDRDTHLP